MKDKWIDYITQITLICLIIVLSFAIDRIIKLNDRVEELEKRILNIEYRVEDISPNDDLPDNFVSRFSY